MLYLRDPKKEAIVICYEIKMDIKGTSKVCKYKLLYYNLGRREMKVEEVGDWN